AGRAARGAGDRGPGRPPEHQDHAPDRPHPGPRYPWRARARRARGAQAVLARPARLGLPVLPDVAGLLPALGPPRAPLRDGRERAAGAGTEVVLIRGPEPVLQLLAHASGKALDQKARGEPRADCIVLFGHRSGAVPGVVDGARRLGLLAGR